MRKLVRVTLKRTFPVTPLLLTGAMLLPGCGGTSQPPAQTGSTAAHDHDHDHDHPTHGPNGGDLIELGNEEYHAEFLHDDSGLLTLILLDSAAKQTVTIEAKELQFNVKSKAGAKQHTFSSVVTEGEPENQHSKFQLTDAELAKQLEEEGTEATLVVTINGKQYRGNLAHKHHEGDGHAH